MGQGQFHFVRDLLDSGLNVDGISTVRPVHPHGHGGVFTNEIGAATIRAQNRHPRHIANGQGRAVLFRAQFNRLNLGGAAFFDTSADARTAARQITGGGRVGVRRNRRRNLGQRQIILHQRYRRHLDQRFGRGKPTDGGARDPRREQAGHEFIGKAPDLIHAHRAGDHHIGHTVAPRAARHLGVIGAIG